MIINFSDNAKKQISKLPKDIVKKFHKQGRFLLKNPRYPSLRSRKMAGEDKFEARIDRHYRFTYFIRLKEIFILSIGPHDEGLGKK